MLDQADHRAAIAGKEHLLGSIGKPATGVDLRIVDDDGNDVPTGVVGNIVTRSDSVMSGYLEMPEETAAAFRDGWFWGGDLRSEEHTSELKSLMRISYAVFCLKKQTQT